MPRLLRKLVPVAAPPSAALPAPAEGDADADAALKKRNWTRVEEEIVCVGGRGPQCVAVCVAVCACLAVSMRHGGNVCAAVAVFVWAGCVRHA